MAVENFVFRENWVGSKVTGMKTTFFAIFDSTWTHIVWAQKAHMRNSLKSILVRKNRNYINFVTLRQTILSEILENNQFFAIFDPNWAEIWL